MALHREGRQTRQKALSIGDVLVVTDAAYLDALITTDQYKLCPNFC